MDIQVTSDYLQLVLAVFAVIAAIYGFVRFSLKSLEAKIIEVTKPIQPDQNGGLSMTDLHKKVDHLIDRVSKIETRVELVEREAFEDLVLESARPESDRHGRHE